MPAQITDYSAQLERYLEEMDEFEDWQTEPGPSAGRPANRPPRTVPEQIGVQRAAA